MNPLLQHYMHSHLERPLEDCPSESFALSSIETFQDPHIQSLFPDQEMTHNLYYYTTDNAPIFPFEIYHNQKLVALGYMIEDEQHILYLKHGNKTLIKKI